MNKILILTDRFISFIDFRKMRGHFANVELVLIVEKIPDSLREIWNEYFDRIHVVSSKKVLESDPLPFYNFNETRDVLINEMKDCLNDEVHLVCFDEGNLILAAEIREDLGIPGRLLTDIIPFRDKLVMKETLSRNNLSVPAYLSFDKGRAEKDSIRYYQEILTQINLPFVLKPKSHASSFGVHVIDDQVEFNEAVMAIKQLDLSYEVEEFIFGDLYHCDILICENEIPFIECARCSSPILNFLSGENIISIPILHSNIIYKKIIEFSKACLSALRAKPGAYHLELFRNESGELTFLEVAARSPGALLVSMYEKMHGVNLVECDFLMQSGIHLSVKPSFNTHCLFALIPSQSGKIIECIEPDIQSNYKIQWKVKEGDFCMSPTSLIDNACLLIAWNDDYSVLEDDFDRLKKYKATNVSSKTG